MIYLDKRKLKDCVILQEIIPPKCFKPKASNNEIFLIFNNEIMKTQIFRNNEDHWKYESPG